MNAVRSPARRVSLLLLLFGYVALPTASRASTAQPAPAGSPLPSQPIAVPLPGTDLLLDARVKAVSSRLRCPVCQGESIQDSPAELSAQMKALVREQLASGKTEKDVFDYFVQKYGQWILLEPKAEGINLLVYWLPVLFLVIGGGGIVIAVRRWTRPATTAVITDAPRPTDSTT